MSHSWGVGRREGVGVIPQSPPPASSVVMHLETGPTTAELVARVRSGESWAAGALYRRHSPDVYRVATVLLRRSADVDDVVQDAFVKALSKIASLRDPAAFGGWVVRIAANLSRSRIRRRGLMRRLGLDRGEEDQSLDRIARPGAGPAEIAELRELADAVAALPPELQVVWTLRRVEEWPLADIVPVAHASLATVKRRLAEADDRLRTHFGPEEEPR